MKDKRYYSIDFINFLKNSEDEILRNIVDTSENITEHNQREAWKTEIKLLKEQLKNIQENGKIIFEYKILSFGKRIDVVLLYKDTIFILEFKCGLAEGKKDINSKKIDAKNQVDGYFYLLHDFHQNSRNRKIVPIAIITKATDKMKEISVNKQGEIEHKIIITNGKNLASIIEKYSGNNDNSWIDGWADSEESPSSNIIEYARDAYKNKQSIFNNQNKENINVVSKEIEAIIKKTIEQKQKSICFVTGVPGSGKTKVGLDLAIKYINDSVFLTGNGALKKILSVVLEEKDDNSAFYIKSFKYYKEHIKHMRECPEIIIFDEAQRAWNAKKEGDIFSEPDQIIQMVNKSNKKGHIVICLIGGGQEINDGETGLLEWFKALNKNGQDWNIYVFSKIMSDDDYVFDMDNEYKSLKELQKIIKFKKNDRLHLNVSKRAKDAENISNFIKQVLDGNKLEAQKEYKIIKKSSYYIKITRNIETAKEEIRNNSDGRYGLVASSKALRLKPYGIYVKNKINVKQYFLNGANKLNSSYALEDVATEFDIQGLELDYVLMAWDADLRFDNGEWKYYKFYGEDWIRISSEIKKRYLKNAYRVLLTRARKGIIIFIPLGDKYDHSRDKAFYDGIYKYLKEIGIEEI